jgi:hypothetical protein
LRAIAQTCQVPVWYLQHGWPGADMMIRDAGGNIVGMVQVKTPDEAFDAGDLLALRYHVRSLRETVDRHDHVLRRLLVLLAQADPQLDLEDLLGPTDAAPD